MVATKNNLKLQTHLFLILIIGQITLAAIILLVLYKYFINRLFFTWILFLQIIKKSFMLSKCFNGAYCNTILIFVSDTGFCNYVGHATSCEVTHKNTCINQIIIVFILRSQLTLQSDLKLLR